MSVDTRAHVTHDTLQECVVLRRTWIWRHKAESGFRRRRSVSFQGHNGDDIRMTLEELGEALRILKITPADLGYKVIGRAPKP